MKLFLLPAFLKILQGNLTWKNFLFSLNFDDPWWQLSNGFELNCFVIVRHLTVSCVKWLAKPIQYSRDVIDITLTSSSGPCCVPPPPSKGEKLNLKYEPWTWLVRGIGYLIYTVLFCSSVVHLFEYIEEGMKRIQDSLKTEKSSWCGAIWVRKEP